MPTLKKAVFPVAGFGSRFLPVTKASPKEMMPVVDKPLIQYAVEEAAAAGITDMIFVTGRHKRAIEDHFDKAYELETELERKGKEALLQQVRSVLPDGVRCIYIRQPEPLGLGHAVLCAQPAVGQEPFAVLLADDLMDSQPPAMARMAEVFAAEKASLLGVEEVPRDQTQSYGIVTIESMQGDQARIRAIVEKPRRAVEPRGDRPLRAHAARLRPARRRHARRGRRDPAHRCDLGAARARARAGGAPARKTLRLRLQARLPAGDRRIRAAPRGDRRRLRALPEVTLDSAPCKMGRRRGAFSRSRTWWRAPTRCAPRSGAWPARSSGSSPRPTRWCWR